MYYGSPLEVQTNELVIQQDILFLMQIGIIKNNVKTNKSRVINSHTVNNYLNRLETELMNQYSRFIDEEIPITKELIKETLDIISGKLVPVEKEEIVPVDFFKFSENYLNQKKDRIEKPYIYLYKGTLTKLKKYTRIKKSYS